MKIPGLFPLFIILLIAASCHAQRITTSADPSSGIFRGDTVEVLGDHLMHILHDSKGNYWFGSWGEGVYRYDGKTILRYCLDEELCNDSIVQMLEDRSGNLYFNARSGLYKFDGRNITSLHVSEYSKNEWKLSPDDLWFKGAQDSGCVYRYDGSILHRLTFPATPEGDTHFKNLPRSQFPHARYSPYDVYTITADRKGNLWFGTSTLGACRYDGKSFKWISASACGHPQQNFGIRSILEDQDGKFWFSKSMFRFDIYSKEVQQHEEWYIRENGIGHPEEMEEKDFIYFLSATVDQDGDLWLATYNDGIYRYDGKNLSHYPVMDHGNHITVFTIYRDQSDDLWLGTHENGVYKFNGKEFQRFLVR